MSPLTSAPDLIPFITKPEARRIRDKLRFDYAKLVFIDIKPSLPNDHSLDPVYADTRVAAAHVKRREGVQTAALPPPLPKAQKCTLNTTVKSLGAGRRKVELVTEMETNLMMMMGTAEEKETLRIKSGQNCSQLLPLRLYLNMVALSIDFQRQTMRKSLKSLWKM